MSAPRCRLLSDIDDEIRFRKWLGRELRSRRMSRRQLGERSGVNASTISRILRGGRRPKLRTAVAIIRAINGATDEASATHYIGAFRDEHDPVAAVERSLRADPAIDEGGITRIMQLYLSTRHESATARRAG